MGWRRAHRAPALVLVLVLVLATLAALADGETVYLCTYSGGTCDSGQDCSEVETDVCISLASLGQAGFAKITPASAAPSSTFDLSVWLATACIGSANLQETVPVDDCTVVGPTSIPLTIHRDCPTCAPFNASVCLANTTAALTSASQTSFSLDLDGLSAEASPTVCIPAAGNCTQQTGVVAFPPGLSKVNYLVRDQAGTAGACTFFVDVRDAAPPEFSGCPAGQLLMLPAPAYTLPLRLVDVSPPLTLTELVTPPSGSAVAASRQLAGPALGAGRAFNFTRTFALGISQVVLTAVDAAGNNASCRFSVRVNDTVAPQLVCPPPLRVAANSANGTKATGVVFPAPALLVDNSGAAPALQFSVANGSTFDLGTTNVTYTATDGAGNAATCVLQVVVAETTPPLITCPLSFSLISDASGGPSGIRGATSAWPNATASDNTGQPPHISYAPPWASALPLGETNITATATDTAGNTASCVYTASVLGAPFLSSVPRSPKKTFEGEDDVRLECRASAFPAADMTWTKDGTVILQASAVDILVLTLPVVSLADAGLYACGASNIYGNITSPSIDLIVDGVVPSCELQGRQTPWLMSRYRETHSGAAPLSPSNPSAPYVTPERSFTLESPTNGTVILPGTHGYATAGTVVVAMRTPLPATDAVRWRYDAGAQLVHTPAFSVLSQRVVVAMHNGSVFALDTVGSLAWQTAVFNGSMAAAPTVNVATDEVLVASQQGQVAVLAPGGAVKWRTQLNPNASLTSPVLSLDTVVVGGSDGLVTALRADNGSVIWQVSARGPVVAAPAAASSGRFFVSTADGKLTALDRKTGTSLWTASLSAATLSSPAVLSDADLVVFSDRVGRLTALRASTGSSVWTYSVLSPSSSSPAADARGVLYFGTDDGSLYAVDTDLGTGLWRHDTKAPIASAPSIGPDNHVYVATTTGVVHSLRLCIVFPAPQTKVVTESSVQVSWDIPDTNFASLRNFSIEVDSRAVASVGPTQSSITLTGLRAHRIVSVRVLASTISGPPIRSPAKTQALSLGLPNPATGMVTLTATLSLTPLTETAFNDTAEQQFTTTLCGLHASLKDCVVVLFGPDLSVATAGARRRRSSGNNLQIQFAAQSPLTNTSQAVSSLDAQLVPNGAFQTALNALGGVWTGVMVNNATNVTVAKLGPTSAAEGSSGSSTFTLPILIGIAAGGLLFLILVILCITYCCRRRQGNSFKGTPGFDAVGEKATVEMVDSWQLYQEARKALAETSFDTSNGGSLPRAAWERTPDDPLPRPPGPAMAAPVARGNPPASSLPPAGSLDLSTKRPQPMGMPAGALDTHSPSAADSSRGFAGMSPNPLLLQHHQQQQQLPPLQRPKQHVPPPASPQRDRASRRPPQPLPDEDENFMGTSPVPIPDPIETMKRSALGIPAKQLTILRDMHEGQFGMVFEGTWRRGTRDVPVIIKSVTVGQDSAKGEDLLDKFYKEAHVILSLNHEHLVTVYGVSTDADTPLLVMEYMANGSIPDYLSQNLRTTTPELLDMGRQIASGMQYLAEKNVVHRDLAARACFLNDNKVVKIAELGFSRILQGLYYLSSSQQPLPIRWLPPESIFYRKFGTASDVWSFGVVLWELMTYCQDFPYEGMSADEVALAVERGHRLEKPLDCPPVVYAMMIRCWCFDPALRPTFADVHRDLSKLCSTFGDGVTDFGEADVPRERQTSFAKVLLAGDGQEPRYVNYMMAGKHGDGDDHDV